MHMKVNPLGARSLLSSSHPSLGLPQHHAHRLALRPDTVNSSCSLSLRLRPRAVPALPSTRQVGSQGGVHPVTVMVAAAAAMEGLGSSRGHNLHRAVHVGPLAEVKALPSQHATAAVLRLLAGPATVTMSRRSASHSSRLMLSSSHHHHHEDQDLGAQAGPSAGGGERDVLSAPQADSASVSGGQHHIGTVAVHAAERSGRPHMSDTLTTPIIQTSTYFFRDTADLIEFVEGRKVSFEYGRYGNPTTDTVERKISALEGAECTLLSSSGMCSATTMLLALVPAGGHIVTTTDCYRRTRDFIQTVLPRMGITTTVIDPSDVSALEAALQEHKVSLFFSESPTNPYLRCIDIARVSALCHSHGATVCIDGTFATPINQQAIALGADLVVNSATKYLAGHHDVLAGSISGRKELVDQIRSLHNVMGGVVDGHAAYLILRGLKTLHLRVERQNTTTLKLAQTLEQHPKVVRVHYPGLPSHPEHSIATRQMTGFGGVVSFEVEGDLHRTSRFIDSLRIPYIAPSLGGVESLVEQTAIGSYWDCGPEERERIGIKDNLVRYCVGVEDADDIIADVIAALDTF